eukprot:CAMPEP_0202729612 /NCGR_PEP_ID=MMETSP1385-20130828/186221_1 /ASSEMBLY_ACC=CAM_ASM_000861 /TAXON_ID=933848 /ORGANISM="Elphidium margaritaceum" /LENGTH=1351 /DNA_ID=CAMNT_0049395879 /DNA_START=144 /DNA_END=4199 /DNA_ORIENTATION=+
MQRRTTDYNHVYNDNSATRKKSTSNAKNPSTSNAASNGQPDDDGNWKLLKFLCDRIEENQKRESELQTTARLKSSSMVSATHSVSPKSVAPPRVFGSYSASSTPREMRPIPLSTDPHHLLAKRKHKRVSKANRVSQTPSHKHSPAMPSHDLGHSKNKSHTALYTSAFHFGDMDAAHASSAAALHHRHIWKPQSQPKMNGPSLSSTSSSSKSASLKFANSDAFSPLRASHHQATSSELTDQSEPVPHSVVFDEKQQESRREAAAAAPLSDPVASLVSLVRRVTKIYGNVDAREDDEQKVADPETIRQIYDRYNEFYQRPPLYPDHLKKFGNRFYPDVRMTYAAAKDFLQSLSKIAEITSPRPSDEKKPLPMFPLESLRESALSTSSPLMIKHDDNIDISSAANEQRTSTTESIRKTMQRSMKKKHSFIEYGLTLQIDADELHVEHSGVPSVSKPEEKSSPTFEFYNMSNLELLQNIKKKVSAACRQQQQQQRQYRHSDDDDEDDMHVDTAAAIHMVWEREYAELEHRLHRAYLRKPYAHYTANPMSNKLAHQYDILKRDRTFLSLKHMSESTNVDDTDHDAAVFLLKTYFPDDEDEQVQMSYEPDHDEDEEEGADHGLLALPSPTHNAHKSSDFHANSNTRLQVKPQQKHIRSITVDRRGKFRSPRDTSMSQSETLSLYDRMVQKARQSKIKSRSQRFRGHSVMPSAASLRSTESAPTPNHGGGRPPLILQTIPSNSDHDIEFNFSTQHSARSSLFSPNEDLVVTPLQAAISRGGTAHSGSGGDDDISLTSTDPAFRQLTTLSLFSAENEEQSLELGGMAPGIAVMNQDTSVNSYISYSSSNLDSDDYKNNSYSTHSVLNVVSAHEQQQQYKFEIPRNLLSIMGKYGDRMERWDLDIFELMDDPLLAGKGLVFASFFLFRKIGLLEVTEIAQANLWRFLESVQLGYKDNPYHNRYHAVDVLFSTHYMFQTTFFKQHMTVWDQLGAYIAALCHDLGHPGFNNEWFVNTAGNLALLYGNESVLENFHISETFRILNESESNWMLSFPSSVRRYVATVIKRSILATDLKVHGTKMIQLQRMVETYKHTIASKLNADHSNQHALICQDIKLWRCESVANYASLDSIKQDDFRLFIDEKRNQEWTRDVVVHDLSIDNSSEDDANGGDTAALHHQDSGGSSDESPKKPRILGVDDERLFLIELTIHACDVANPCKPLHLAKEWANRFLREAFNQGDHERNIGIPVSSGFDRHTTKLASSQLGFIIYVVKRLFQLYGEIVDIKDVVDIMLTNEQYWIQEKQKMIAASTGLFQLYGEIIDIRDVVDIMLTNEQYWIQEKQKMIAASTAKKKSNQNLMVET